MLPENVSEVKQFVRNIAYMNLSGLFSFSSFLAKLFFFSPALAMACGSLHRPAEFMNGGESKDRRKEKTCNMHQSQKERRWNYMKRGATLVEERLEAISS